MSLYYMGRKIIRSQFTQDDLQSKENVMQLVNDTIDSHNMNKHDIDYLMNYYTGKQPILLKEKIVRPEINNIMVVNHAQRITRTIVGYFLGNAVQYIHHDATLKNEVDELNRVLAYEDKYSVDKEIGEYQSITGTSYRIIYSDGLFADEVPFEEKSLSPSKTYVVYENTIASKPLAGITFHTMYKENEETPRYRYYVYTTTGVWSFISTGVGKLNEGSFESFEAYNVGGIPIIEYPNNQWRMGDWEFAMQVMDSINKVQSSRLDDLEQIVQSLLVFTNAEIDEEVYKEMREQGVVMLKNLSGQKSDVDILNNPLDQSGFNVYSKELEFLLDTLVGVPNRDNRSGGGGDTGQAVELRDGWADLEIVARNKEGAFVRSEKMALKIILSIMNAKKGTELKLKDIDIKFSRNKNHNLLVKTQSYTNLLQTKTLTPSDSLSIVDLVSDENEYTARGEQYWEEKEKIAIDKQKQVLDEDSENVGANPVAIDNE